MKTETKVLLVEDDPNILLGLQELLSQEGFEVAACRRGDAAVESVAKVKPHVIILDVMLPGKSGYDVCKALRSQGCAVPILMLTAKGQEIDKVIGLDFGADDYVTKPFGVRELVARLRALLRRQPGRSSKDKPTGTFQIGDVTIDPTTYLLRRGKTEEQLTAKELKLLQFFAEHLGEVLSRDRLLTEVWGYEYMGSTRTLDQVIVQLRKKLGDSASAPQHLTTVHGVGYRLKR